MRTDTYVSAHTSSNILYRKCYILFSIENISRYLVLHDYENISITNFLDMAVAYVSYMLKYKPPLNKYLSHFNLSQLPVSRENIKAGTSEGSVESITLAINWREEVHNQC